MERFPSKKDFWYFFAIFIIVDLFLLLHWVTHPSVLGAKLELASTLISIILSVIAIIFTLVESINNKATSGKIIEASDIIQNVTDNINTSTNTLSDLTIKLVNLDIDKKLEGFNAILEGLNENVCVMNETFSHDIKEIRDFVINTNHSLDKTPSSDDKAQIDIMEMRKVGIDLINRLNDEFYHKSEIIYLVFKIKENDKSLFPSSYEYIKNHLHTEENKNTPLETGVCYCLLGVMAHLYCLNWDRNTSKIIYFDDGFLELVTKFQSEKPDIAKFIDDYVLNYNK